MRRLFALFLLAVFVTGCRKEPATAEVPQAHRPRARIISFSPGITDLLFDMGLGDQVVGVTRFCMLPPGQKRPSVGSALMVETESLLALKPDVIFAQGGLDRFRGLRQVAPNLRIVNLQMATISDVSAALEKVGQVMGRPDAAKKTVARFRARLRMVRDRPHRPTARRLLFVIGTDRPMVAGPGTFIDDLIDIAGGINAGRDVPGAAAWRSTQLEHILDARPDVIICQELGTGGHERSRRYWLQWRGAAGSAIRQVHVVSDRRWTIPSTRSADFAEKLARMLEPSALAAPVEVPERLTMILGVAIATAVLIAGLLVLTLVWRRVSKLLLVAAALLALLAAVMVACSLLGKVPVWDEFGWRVWQSGVWQARISRLLLAAVVGAGLAAGGLALQGLFRNPLANPYILGVSSGAGVGVLLGLALAAWYAVPDWVTTPALAFVGALVTCVLVYGIAQRRGKLDPYSLILSGVIVNTFNAAVMLTIYLYVDPFRIADFAHWGMGELPDSVDVVLLGVCGGCILAGWALLLVRGTAFNALSLGDDVAQSVGVGVHRLRMEVFIIVGLMTACAVAMAGPIGFVGLIVPHICRMLLGPDHRRLAVAAGVVGAVFLMLADTLCRNVGHWIGVSKVPVGILTAFCGGPFFIFLLRRRFKEGGQ